MVSWLLVKKARAKRSTSWSDLQEKSRNMHGGFKLWRAHVEALWWRLSYLRLRQHYVVLRVKSVPCRVTFGTGSTWCKLYAPGNSADFEKVCTVQLSRSSHCPLSSTLDSGLGPLWRTTRSQETVHLIEVFLLSKWSGFFKRFYPPVPDPCTDPCNYPVSHRADEAAGPNTTKNHRKQTQASSPYKFRTSLLQILFSFILEDFFFIWDLIICSNNKAHEGELTKRNRCIKP